MIKLDKLIKLKDATLKLVRDIRYGREIECDIKGRHAHKFVNKYGFTRYVEGDRPYFKGYEMTDGHIMLGEKEAELLKYLNKKKILRIDDNIEKIRRDQKRLKPYYEYQYEYEDDFEMPVIEGTGKDQTITYIRIPNTSYDWTTNLYHSDLTGYRRLCTYQYRAFRIDEDDHGWVEYIDSPEKHDIIATKDKYPYIEESYYYVVNGDKEEFSIREERARLNGDSKKK